MPKMIVKGMIPQNSAPAKGPVFANSHENVLVIPMAAQLPKGAANPRKSGAVIKNENAPEKTIRRFLGICLSIKWNTIENIHTDKITGKMEPL